MIRTPIWTADRLRAYFNWLNEAKEMSFRDISELPWLNGMPFGSVSTFANGGPVPKKWRSTLGLDTPRDLFSYPISQLRDMMLNREEWK